MTLFNRKLVITLQILSNVSRCKGSQTHFKNDKALRISSVNYGQLIEHNMRNIFPKELYRKRNGKISPRPFSKKS